MDSKKAAWIRLAQISNLAQDIIDKNIIDYKKTKELDMEVSAMLRQLSSNKKFFKRLS